MPETKIKIKLAMPMRSFWVWAICISSAYLLLIAVDDSNSTLKSLGISSLAIFGFLYYLSSRKSNRDPFHPDIFFAITHLVQFIIPAFIISIGLFNSYWHIQTKAASENIAEATFAIMLAQFLFCLPFCFFEPPTKTINESRDPVGLFFIILLGVLVWMARYFILATSSYFHFGHSSFRDNSIFYSPLAILSKLSVIVAIFALIYIFKVQKISKSKLAYSYLIAELIWHMFSGAREGFIIFILIMILVPAFIYKKIKFSHLAFFLVISFAFGSFVHFYRNSIIHQANTGKTSIYKAIIQGYQSQVSAGLQKSIWVMIERLNSIKYTAGCMQHFPEKIAFLNGSTYSNMLWAPLPQSIFPDKPKSKYEYNSLIQPQITGTLAPLTAVGEAYINFGWYGILIVFFLSGIVCRLIDSNLFIRSHVSAFIASMWIFFYTLMIRMAAKPAFSGFSWIFKIFIIILSYRIACRIYEYYISKSQKI